VQLAVACSPVNGVAGLTPGGASPGPYTGSRAALAGLRRGWEEGLVGVHEFDVV